MGTHIRCSIRVASSHPEEGPPIRVEETEAGVWVVERDSQPSLDATVPLSWSGDDKPTGLCRCFSCPPPTEVPNVPPLAPLHRWDPGPLRGGSLCFFRGPQAPPCRSCVGMAGGGGRAPAASVDRWTQGRAQSPPPTGPSSHSHPLTPDFSLKRQPARAAQGHGGAAGELNGGHYAGL